MYSIKLRTFNSFRQLEFWIARLSKESLGKYEAPLDWELLDMFIQCCWHGLNLMHPVGILWFPANHVHHVQKMGALGHMVHPSFEVHPGRQRRQYPNDKDAWQHHQIPFPRKKSLQVTLPFLPNESFPDSLEKTFCSCLHEVNPWKLQTISFPIVFINFPHSFGLIHRLPIW